MKRDVKRYTRRHGRYCHYHESTGHTVSTTAYLADEADRDVEEAVTAKISTRFHNGAEFFDLQHERVHTTKREKKHGRYIELVHRLYIKHIRLINSRACMIDSQSWSDF